MGRRKWIVAAALFPFFLQAESISAQVSGHAANWGRQGVDCAPAPRSETKPWKNSAHKPECRARYALNEFKTVEEKFLFLDPPRAPVPGLPAAAPATYPDGRPIRDVARILDLPRIASSDGPAGVVNGKGATAFPTPLTVAATFDPGAAGRYGDLLGGEFRAGGFGTALGPAMDMARSWRFGRLTESFGEDPFLVAQMVGPEIRAIQARNVIVTMKHYAVYAQEAGRVGDAPAGSRPTVDNRLSERALREIYLPGFEAAVKVGGAGGAMCSFPRVNGVYACENPHLFDILKREWGFDGSVMPDFPSAQRSITRAFLTGLDGGSMGPNPFNAGLADEKTLQQAWRDGEVPEARIDDLILRRLIPSFRIGSYDNPPPRLQPHETAPDISTPAVRAAAAELVTQGAVLLKNKGDILPLGPGVRRIAVIGTQATDRAVVVEQGSPHVTPAHLVAVLPAVQQRAGPGVTVNFAPGTLGLAPLPSPEVGTFRTPGGAEGFTADYFANPNMEFSGKPLASRTEARPSIARAPDIAGLPANNQWSVRYTAVLAPTASGVHKFSVHGSGSVRLWVDGKLQSAFDLADFRNAAWANVPLQAGRRVEVRIDYGPRAALGAERRNLFGIPMGLTMEFGYAPPDDLIAEAAAAARTADVALVFVGEQVGEGMDRPSLSLQNHQDALIEAVAKANPHTVVVLTTGGPVKMPWLDKVAGVLEMWLPGDAFGPAAASLIFGDREPGGRLPITFPADEKQGPATGPSQFPGTRNERTGELDKAWFDEGVLIGYRWWDQMNQEPLFPFGYGQGYAKFEVNDESVDPTPDGGAVVRASVRNLSEREGSEVVQVYLGFPDSARAAPKQLKGFQKLTLQPGETRKVEIRLAPAAFRYWDEDEADWIRPGGEFAVMVGTSAGEITWSSIVH